MDGALLAIIGTRKLPRPRAASGKPRLFDCYPQSKHGKLLPAERPQNITFGRMDPAKSEDQASPAGARAFDFRSPEQNSFLLPKQAQPAGVKCPKCATQMYLATPKRAKYMK